MRWPSSVTTTRSSIRTPSSPGQVDAGLDRHHLAGLQGVLGAAAEPRRLVDLEADAVAEPVAEALAVAGFVDHLARDASTSLPPSPAATASSAGCLGPPHQLVDLAAPRSPGSPMAKVRVQSEQ